MIGYSNTSKMGISVLALAMMFFPLLTSSQDQSYQTTMAKYYEMSDGFGTPGGSCGYGEYGRRVNNGKVAAAAMPILYRSGARCGACYQIKCTQPECSSNGVKVVVTDSAMDADAGFILNARSFTGMANPGQEKQLKEYGNIPINYKRITCDYARGRTLQIKILEQSRNPDYLAFVFLNQGGSSDILAVEVFEEDTVEWKACERSYGAVWRIVSPPKNALTFRIFLPGSSSRNAKSMWVLLPKAVPSSWRAGAAYDTSVRIV